MIIIIFIALICNCYGQIGQTICSDFYESECFQSGYCYWDDFQCNPQPCHLVTEQNACRTGGALQIGCKPVSYTPPQFVASCYSSAYTKQKIYLYRFISDLSPEDRFQTSVTIEQPSVEAMEKLYKLDLLSSSNFELNNILDSYLNQAPILIGEYSHPYYLERAIYESLQNVRDDLKIIKSERSDTMIKILELIDIYYQRLNTYSEKYSTFYNFVNFNHIHFKYLGFSFQNLIELSWTTYPENGFFSLTVIYPQIFGIQSAVSPIFMIRTTNQINLQYTMKWAITTTDFVQLRRIDLVSMNLYDAEYLPNCISGYCTVSVYGPGNYLFVTPTIPDNCSGITDLTLCILAKCNIVSNACV
ncbi:unnamed protein product (macronuclear) [Paramecium tetraurelia]|uniref:LNR domain-containing protein n=1 Tax=Paramecium tetraurelia TaxID=5888 RepID=A0BF48_PARTE|nr:uncharacterized protein GSPATT00028200001 [Paramecium tetraurelia]CAK57165.1 unnamed protein product [Paramecium tetraurelia]|eukprot:XP_001424563.1 hypothetical protein (macronuclear) [Paramecium tetraurelia strain d4-2]